MKRSLLFFLSLIFYANLCSCNGITVDLLLIYAGYKAFQGSRPAQAVLAFSGAYYCNDQSNLHSRRIQMISNKYPEIKDHEANMSVLWGVGSLVCLGTCIYLLNQTNKNPAPSDQILNEN